jgi:hypothetical protein
MYKLRIGAINILSLNCYRGAERNTMSLMGRHHNRNLQCADKRR